MKRGPKMSRMPGHSMSIAEQDQLIQMYNDLIDHCDMLFETLEKVSGVLELVGKAAGIEVKP